MLARRRGQMLIEAGVDKVLWGMGLPKGTVLHDIKGEIQITGSSDLFLTRTWTVSPATYSRER